MRRQVDGGPTRLLFVRGLPVDEMSSFVVALFLNLRRMLITMSLSACINASYGEKSERKLIVVQKDILKT